MWGEEKRLKDTRALGHKELLASVGPSSPFLLGLALVFLPRGCLTGSPEPAGPGSRELPLWGLVSHSTGGQLTKEETGDTHQIRKPKLLPKVRVMTGVVRSVPG